MKVTIRLPALINMVVSSIEVYKKEAFGFLLGRRQRGNYIVDHAVIFQSAKRDYEYIALDSHRQNRINKTLRFLVNQKYVGEFHSHADFPEKLSKTDIREMKKIGEGIVSLLVVVKKSRQFYKWIYNARERSISGTVGDYFVKVMAFEYYGEKIEKLPIACPHIKQINKIRKIYEKIQKNLDKADKQKKHAMRTKKRLKKKLMLSF
ncbi:Mov34/MPN/PAD-1 family protein [Candidatus Aenigmatarchaeota archaeon]